MQEVRRAGDKLLKQYGSCVRCGSGPQSLLLGGSGDWKDRIVCMECFHIRHGVPLEALEAVAEAGGLLCSGP